MAKKKSETDEGAVPKKPAARAGKKAVGKKAAPAAPASSSMVDTDLAAANAARMLASRAKLGPVANTPTDQKESASFRQLKESLKKPAEQSVDNLSKALGPQKTHLPLSQYNQVFHNQTQGGVGRVNVPRRTPG